MSPTGSPRTHNRNRSNRNSGNAINKWNVVAVNAVVSVARDQVVLGDHTVPAHQVGDIEVLSKAPRCAVKIKGVFSHSPRNAAKIKEV